jgi:lycopene beta-cyclase
MAVKAQDRYDFIIAGMGCAGLSLAMQLRLSSVKFEKVLIIDKHLKNTNDRTWCFWSRQKKNWFDEVVFRKWDRFSFKSVNIDKTLGLDPYSYMMIRGIDFYDYCLSTLKKDTRFEIVTSKIERIGTLNGMAFLDTERQSFYGSYLFNSCFRKYDFKTNHINYVQHFKGWLIETREEVFNEDLPVFMDFDVEQYNDCRFVYLLPICKTKALVEYTGFSKASITDEQYDRELKNYIENKLLQKAYTVLEQEKGTIPMYESAFINPFGNSVINIGTAGGYSKPSTGYTFYFIQQNIQKLIIQLEQNSSDLRAPVQKKKYSLYDKTLLDVMNRKEIASRSVFSDLFRKNKISDLLAFLNEESTFAQDVRIMNSVPKSTFIFSAIKVLLKR